MTIQDLLRKHLLKKLLRCFLKQPDMPSLIKCEVCLQMLCVAVWFLGTNAFQTILDPKMMSELDAVEWKEEDEMQDIYDSFSGIMSVIIRATLII